MTDQEQPDLTTPSKHVAFLRNLSDRQAEEIDRLGKENETLRRELAAQDRQLLRYDSVDYACAQCEPGSEAVIDGFACAYHRALARQVSAQQQRAPSEPELGERLRKLLEGVATLDTIAQVRALVGSFTSCPACGSEPWVNLDCKTCTVMSKLEPVEPAKGCAECTSPLTCATLGCARMIDEAPHG